MARFITETTGSEWRDRTIQPSASLHVPTFKISPEYETFRNKSFRVKWQRMSRAGSFLFYLRFQTAAEKGEPKRILPPKGILNLSLVDVVPVKNANPALLDVGPEARRKLSPRPLEQRLQALGRLASATWRRAIYGPQLPGTPPCASRPTSDGTPPDIRFTSQKTP